MQLYIFKNCKSYEVTATINQLFEKNQFITVMLIYNCIIIYLPVCIQISIEISFSLYLIMTVTYGLWVSCFLRIVGQDNNTKCAFQCSRQLEQKSHRRKIVIIPHCCFSPIDNDAIRRLSNSAYYVVVVGGYFFSFCFFRVIN